MHGQGNYTTQGGQGSFAPPFAFQQRPVPPPSLQGSLHQPPQAIQQGHPSFHLRPGIFGYQHTKPNTPQQGPHAPAVSTGMNSAQSYATPPQPLQGQTNTQMSFSYPTSMQQRAPWTQNVHQFPPAGPPLAPTAYPLVSLQEHALERGPSHQPSFHTPPPSQPPNAFSNSKFLRHSQGPSSLPVRQHSYPQPMGSLPPRPLPPPPPPPPPPLPSSSPPGAPPLPPSSPPSNVLSHNDGSCSLKGEIKDGDNLMMECSALGNPMEERGVLITRKCQYTEYADSKVELGDGIVTHSPVDSDMDMEDDITLPDMDKKNSLLNNLNDETSQNDHMEEQLQGMQDTGIHILSKVDLDGSAVSSTSNNPRGDDEPSRVSNRQSVQPLDVPASELGNFCKPSVAVACAETDYGKRSGQVSEGTNPFNLLQNYASDGTSENEGEKLAGDAISLSIKDGSKIPDAEKGCNFGSEQQLESVSECSKHMVPKSVIESANVMEADKMSLEASKLDNFSNKSNVGQESVRLQSKDAPRNYSTDIYFEGAKLHQPDRQSNATDLNVDEFGRLIREGVSDSDTSDSPGYTRRPARRARKRSRSQSRSQSPHEWRRRGSPWRKQRRGRSRSWSPKSRSRSPFMRRDAEFTGDKLRREKGQPPACFNFVRGKCYRGTACRYSHHESDKSERKRYNRGEQQYRDKPPALQSPEFHDNAFPEKEVKHKGPSPGQKEVKDSKGLPVDSAFYTHKDDKDSSLLVADVVANNVSGYSSREITSGREDSVIRESLAAGKIHQINQQCQRINDSLVSESSVMEVSVNSSRCIPTDKTDVKQYPTSQMPPPETKPFFTEMPSQPLKELPPPSTSHLSHSQSTLALSSVSQVVSVPFTQPLMQDYSLMPSIARFHATPGNYSPNRIPISYQHSQFNRPSNALSSSFLLPALPPPSHSHFSSNITTRECSFPSQHMQHSSLPPQDNSSAYASRAAQTAECPNRSWTGEFQVYSTAGEPDQGPHGTNSFESRLNSRLGDPHMRGEDCRNGHPVQGMNPSQPFVQGHSNSLSVHSTTKGMQSSVVGNPSDNNSPCTQPYFQQASYDQQYTVTAAASAQFTETGKVSSSISNLTPDFLERSHPYVREVGSRISNHFNPYASTFDLPLSSKFSANILALGNDLNINTRYGSPFALTSGPAGDGHKIGSFGLKSGMPLSSGLPAASVVPRPGGAQYDPLFDSIEPASNSFIGAVHQKHETVGDSDDVLRLSGSGRMLDIEGIKQEGGTAVSANDSVENEEYGETADAEVGAVLTGSPSNPNDATDMNAGEVEINQVKAFGKKKKSKARSMKLFKISIASFVKEVLKPSWRQGNMSKEAFKTIVKKTVDKVSGAMKSHRIPRSQSRINQYIDSSRGKLTKLVMGYVDKYVKV